MAVTVGSFSQLHHAHFLCSLVMKYCISGEAALRPIPLGCCAPSNNCSTELVQTEPSIFVSVEHNAQVKLAHTRLPSVGFRSWSRFLVLDSQPAGDMSHKPDDRLWLLSARPAVTLATLKRAAANFGTMGVNSLPKSVTRQRRGCDMNPGRSAPESSTLTTRLPSHWEHNVTEYNSQVWIIQTVEYINWWDWVKTPEGRCYYLSPSSIIGYITNLLRFDTVGHYLFYNKQYNTIKVFITHAWSAGGRIWGSWESLISACCRPN